MVSANHLLLNRGGMSEDKGNGFGLHPEVTMAANCSPMATLIALLLKQVYMCTSCMHAFES